MATHEVIWARVAERDLGRIIDYIAAEDLDRALEALEAIRQHCARLSDLPARGRIVPELQAMGITAYRELIFQNWRIVYNIAANQVRVLACFDARRNLEDVLLQRLLD